MEQAQLQKSSDEMYIIILYLNKNKIKYVTEQNRPESVSSQHMHACVYSMPAEEVKVQGA